MFPDDLALRGYSIVLGSHRTTGNLNYFRTPNKITSGLLFTRQVSFDYMCLRIEDQRLTSFAN